MPGSMKSLCVATLVLVLFVPVPAMSYQGVNNIYAELLLTKDPDNIKFATKSIFNDQATEIELYDLVAKIMTLSENGDIQLDEDTLCWLIKALGGSASQRYSALIEDYATEKNSRKIQRFASQALDNLVLTSEQLFDPPSIDLENVEESLQVYIANTRQNKSIDLKIPKGMFVDELYSQIGHPDYVYKSEKLKELGIRGYGRVQLSLLTLFYRDYGIIRFDHANGSRWYVEAQTYDYKNTYLPEFRVIFPQDEFEKTPFSLAETELLLSINPRALSRLCQSLIDNKSFDRRTLDIAALRLWLSKAQDDDQMSVGLSWVAKYIGFGRQARHKNILAYLSTNATHKNLRRYAENYIHWMVQGDPEPYKPAALESY